MQGTSEYTLYELVYVISDLKREISNTPTSAKIAIQLQNHVSCIYIYIYLSLKNISLIPERIEITNVTGRNQPQ